MLQKILNNKVRLMQFILLVALLMLIRAFENQLFYDPFLDYFRSDFNNLPLPSFNSFQLFLGLLFRYGLNMRSVIRYNLYSFQRGRYGQICFCFVCTFLSDSNCCFFCSDLFLWGA